ncbi:MAG: glycosyltransferase, partial [Pseudomonadota bacterium]
MITPIWPDASGNGLARRADLFVSALAKVGPVDVLVLPIFRSGKVVSPMSPSSETVRYLEVAQTALPDSRFALLRMLADADDRLAAFISYGKPSVCGSISVAALPASLELVAGQAYRHVHVFRNYCAPLGLSIASRIELQQGKPVLKTLDVDEDDASVFRAVAAGKLRSRRLVDAQWNQQEAQSHEELSRSVLSDFNAVFVASRLEKRNLNMRYGVSAIELPNAVDIDLPINTNPSSGALLFVGTMGYYPNKHALDWFLRHCWPTLAATTDLSLEIVGSGPPADLRRYNNIPRIKAFGWVDDMKRHYRKAQLFIAPLQIGGGTRLKLLDAAAHGLPIVSTSKGAEGIGLRRGADFWKADTPFAFTTSV